MIVKKVKNPKKSASKAARVGKLADYIHSPESENSNEKCIYSGARGFICDDYPIQKAEMLALSQEAVRSKDTINHYVLSWREGEKPSSEQVEKAVSIFMDELGLKEHQVIYGLHADTDNIHLHLAINRVHPETLKVIKPNKGFDIEAAHKAIARIEQVQGWQREQNGRYQVLDNGELGREQSDTNKSRQPDQTKRDMEQRTGEKSAERIAIEDGAPIIKKALTWSQLHRELAEKGMRYEKTGSGATLFVGDVGVKASSADRGASLIQLQKRLGKYEPSTQWQEVAKRAAEPIKQGVAGWDTYIIGRKAHYAAKYAATRVQKQQQDADRKQLSEQQKKHRGEVLQGSWKGRGELRNAMQSIVAAEQAAEKVILKERHQKEREQLRQQYRPYPDLEQWQRQQNRPELAEQWRYRAGPPQRIEGDRSEPPIPRDIRAYVPEIVGQQVHYTRKENIALGGSASFVDKGRSIDIYDWRSRDSTLAALQLSAQKWGSFQVTGNNEYKAMCTKLAAEHGFKISNPELQESIQQERQRIQQDRVQKMQEKAQKIERDGMSRSM